MTEPDQRFLQMLLQIVFNIAITILMLYDLGIQKIIAGTLMHQDIFYTIKT